MTAVDDTDLLLDTVERFGAKARQRLFAEESPDGDLAAVEPLLADAAALGLLADTEPDTGRWGVWGQHIETDGAATSLDILRRLGHVCAGLATAIHAQGVAVVLAGAGATPPFGTGDDARLAAAFGPPVGIALDPRAFGDGLMLRDQVLSGTARFALVPQRADALVLAARTGPATDDTWAVVVVPTDLDGVRLLPTGTRIGLRACGVADVHAEQVRLDDAHVRATGPAAERQLRRAVACDWLGQAAIALGAAEHAVTDATQYALTRIQGGAPIIEHAAVKLLLGKAEHDTAVLADVLRRHATTPVTDLDPTELLRWAADARLAAGEHAARAVTDALQTLGGYGYMDEYGLSKRLRDLTALRAMHGGPDQLLLLRHSLGGAR